MKPLPKEYLSRLIRAVVEFQLIEDNDRILIGLSGGKDSLFMAYALTELKNTLKKNFSLGAITINPMFTKISPAKPCRNSVTGWIYRIIFMRLILLKRLPVRTIKTPAIPVRSFRRGAINGYAKEHGYNKVAYAHNHDDAVETFFMNYFTPVS